MTPQGNVVEHIAGLRMRAKNYHLRRQAVIGDGLTELVGDGTLLGWDWLYTDKKRAYYALVWLDDQDEEQEMILDTAGAEHFLLGTRLSRANSARHWCNLQGT